MKEYNSIKLDLTLFEFLFCHFFIRELDEKCKKLENGNCHFIHSAVYLMVNKKNNIILEKLTELEPQEFLHLSEICKEASEKWKEFKENFEID